MDEISRHMQSGIVYLSIVDDTFCKLCVNIPEEVFTTEVTQLCFSTAIQYYNKFGKAPKDHFHDEILRVTSTKSPEERENIASYLYGIRSMTPPNKDYIISRLDAFLKGSALMKVTYEFAELVEQQKFEEATVLMQEALKVGLQDTTEVEDFINDYSDLDSRGDAPKYAVDFGIPLIDETVGGLSYGDLVTILGPLKGGKSWSGLHLVKRAVYKGLNAVYISHENSAAETRLRLDMMLGKLVNEKVPKEVLIKYMDERGRVKEKLEVRDTAYNHELIIKNRKRLGKNGGKLIIKKFPMGSCSAVDLNNFLEKLESFHGFKADVVVTDYADVMKSIKEHKEKWDNLNDTYQYLKRIADERQLVMVTMSQINREGLKAAYYEGKIDATHVAGDIRKIATIDKGFFIATPRELEDQNEMVFGCFANRSKAQGGCILGYNYTIGQFCTYSYKPERD